MANCWYFAASSCQHSRLSMASSVCGRAQTRHIPSASVLVWFLEVYPNWTFSMYVSLFQKMSWKKRCGLKKHKTISYSSWRLVISTAVFLPQAFFSHFAQKTQGEINSTKRKFKQNFSKGGFPLINIIKGLLCLNFLKENSYKTTFRPHAMFVLKSFII